MNMNMEMKMDMVTKTMEVNKSFLHCPKEEKCNQRPAQNHDS